MGCPLKELDTSALSVSPRRLTEGVLEVEGPTSADAGVASCLPVNAEPVFRRLRDDFWDGIVFVVGMRRLGGIELPKGSVGNLSKTVELPWHRQNGNNRTDSAARLEWTRLARKRKKKISKRKKNS